MAKKTKKEEWIFIKKPDIQYIRVKITSESALNVHRLGKKLKEEFKQRDQNKPKKKRLARDYHAEFLDSLHVIDRYGQEVKSITKITKNTRFGFPASGLKKAMISACRQYDNLKMTEVKGRFFVCGKYIEIKGTPEMDEFWRRIGGKGPGTGTPDIGIRAVFPEWESTVKIKYNADVISKDSVVNLLFTAGFAVGLGEDRPDKTGNSFGQWTVA